MGANTSKTKKNIDYNSGRNVVVENTGNLTESDIIWYFKRFGAIDDVSLKNGYAIVHFKTEKIVLKALESSQQIIKGRNTNVRQFYRKTCKYSSLIKHHNKDVTQSDDTEYQDLRKSFISANSVEDQSQCLLDCLLLTQEDINIRETAQTYLSNLFSRYFIYSKLYIFGSSINNLGLKNCDMDMLLSIRSKLDDAKIVSYADKFNPLAYDYFVDLIINKKRKINTNELKGLTAEDIICLLYVILEREGTGKCSKLEVVPSRYCPIVRFNYNNSNGSIPCDLSIKNRLAVYNSRLIKFFTGLDSRVRALIVLVRFWVTRKRFEFTKVNRLSSYATSLLCIHYLQAVSPPILPTLEEMRKLECKNRTISGLNCSFCDDVSKYSPSHNVEKIQDLLAGFFLFYQQFDFARNVINIVTRKTVDVVEFSSLFPAFRINNLHVQDPFELYKNVTGNIDRMLAEKVIICINSVSEKCRQENIWVAQKGALWGLPVLFANEKEEENPLSDNEILPMKRSLQALEKPIMTRVLIIPAEDMESLRRYTPTKSTDPTPTNKDCFNFICQILSNIFKLGLKFTCSEDCRFDGEILFTQYYTELEAEGFVDSTMANKRLKFSLTELEDKKDDRISQSNSIVVTVRYNTWTNRDSVSNAMSVNKGQSIINHEGSISDNIIVGMFKDNSGILSKFVYDVQCTKFLDVYLRLKSDLDSGNSELTKELFAFLTIFIPKLFKKMKDAGDYS